MEEPSARTSRLALAGVVAAALVVGGVGFLLGRNTAEPAQIVVAPPTPAPEPAPEPEPVLSGVLGRSDLIELAAAAADAAASGERPRPQVAAADGRRFELRLPFGCDGPALAESSAPMRWRYDEEDQALRLHVDPITWSAADWWSGDAAAAIETVEGFWITRPWTSSEACPPGGGGPLAPGPDPVTLPGQTLALGQIFFAEGARGGRRDGKPYQTVVRVPEDELDTSKGFRLRLSGRIASSRGVGPVRCRQPAGPEQRPICLISVLMDEVAIENPATGKTVATWTVASRETPQDR